MAKNEIYENDIKQEKALLVSVDTGDYDAESSLLELKELVVSAGAEPVLTVVQKRPAPDTATCVGSGMLEEIAEHCRQREIDLIVFDRELSPTQLRNIEKVTDVHTIDRTMLILDIFALRAITREGKLQVELAQLKYMMPRLTGKGVELSRLGGGIGTRGPGETKLETDRRHINRRIQSLREQLAEVEKHRELINSRRRKDGTVTVALVGYTNVGKSTLMNRLTQAGVLAENMLFATLDPTARALKLPSGKEVMLIDTVGLVRRLPHHLVEAFRSTLEQAAQADIILNICDASSEETQVHQEVTLGLLNDLKSEGTVITVLNKCDLLERQDDAFVKQETVRISAATGEGIDSLLEAVENALPQKNVRITALLPFSEGALAAEMRQDGAIISEEYVAEGLKIEAMAAPYMLEKIRKYLIDF